MRSCPKVRKRTDALAVLSLATLPLEWPPGGQYGNISPRPVIRQMPGKPPDRFAARGMFTEAENPHGGEGDRMSPQAQHP